MAVRVAMNGFGRIGRMVYRALLESGRKDIELIAINDLGSPESNAHLLRYDSVHGPLASTVEAADNLIKVDGNTVSVLAERDPSKLPWAELGIDIVAECTGIFSDRNKAELHLSAGAKRVLVSAPSKGADLTVVYGVNHDKITNECTIVSNASCTTNCLAPVVHVLDGAYGLKHGYMTTVHAFTGDQSTVDTLHSDARRSRAASVSMIPTSTGAARAVGEVLPNLKGRLDGSAIRVPTPNVSMIDLKCVLATAVSEEEVNAKMLEASKGYLGGVLAVNKLPLVSVDFNHNPASSIFDSTQTKVLEGDFLRVLAWYDNEWGFSNRMLDTLVAMGHHL
ncbi:MAG: type I glyceraldehyde-3-phosphate dehydrogenase [Rhodospirillaceae bacterium]|nr:type I glyceraldehyde-3-phosphate dehydrogenase [Rhodospirillaceae bacterium]